MEFERAAHRYKKIKLLKEGGFGKASLYEDTLDSSLCVIKEMKTQSMTQKEVEEIKKEAHILKVLKHPNIIQFRDLYMNKKQRLCIVMDYAEAGDLAGVLDKYVKKNSYLSEEQILDWFAQICLAIKHIHDRKIVHRDLKSQNIFLTRMGMIKLGDFGISKILTHTQEFLCSFVGTWYYISPEIIQSKPYNFKTDIWSLGVILYEMCCLRLPFRGANQFILQKKIKEGTYQSIPSRYSRDMNILISKLLKSVPEERPSIYQILAMPIVNGRISKFLSQRLIKDEFSHTVLHNQNVLRDNILKKKQYSSANQIGISKLITGDMKRQDISSPDNQYVYKPMAAPNIDQEKEAYVDRYYKRVEGIRRPPASKLLDVKYQPKTDSNFYNQNAIKPIFFDAQQMKDVYRQQFQDQHYQHDLGEPKKLDIPSNLIIQKDRDDFDEMLKFLEDARRVIAVDYNPQDIKIVEDQIKQKEDMFEINEEEDNATEESFDKNFGVKEMRYDKFLIELLGEEPSEASMLQQLCKDIFAQTHNSEKVSDIEEVFQAIEGKEPGLLLSLACCSN